MRRVLGFTLVGLGAFAVVLGLLLRGYLYPTLAKLPLDPANPDPGRPNQQQRASTVLVAEGATYLDRGTGRPVDHRTLTLRVKVAGDLTAPESKVNGDVAVWRTGTTVMDGDTKISVTTVSACLDRHTGMAVADCSRASVTSDDRTTDPAGITGLVDTFPFGTQKKDYPYYDSVILAAVPMRYSGTDTVNGLPVYRFVQDIPPTQAQEVQVPGDLVGGDPSQLVNAHLFYQNRRVVWVEPVSGVIVKDQEDMRETLRGPDNREGAVALAGPFVMTPESVRDLTDQAVTAKRQLLLLSGTGPTVLVLGGLLLALLGVALVAWPRRGRRRTVPARPGGEATTPETTTPEAATPDAAPPVGSSALVRGRDAPPRQWSPPDEVAHTPNP